MSSLRRSDATFRGKGPGRKGKSLYMVCKGTHPYGIANLAGGRVSTGCRVSFPS